MPRISVIVPIYNVERYLSRCIDSILSQSFADFELILVDDGSPDRCGMICDDYARKDKRIRVIHQKNARLSAARNAGIDIAQGEWIAFVDSDDWLHKDYLKILLSGALEDTELVICGCLITSNEMETDQEYSEMQFRSLSMKEVYGNRYARSRAWGRIVRRTSIGELRYIPGAEPAEDIFFNELLFREDMTFRVTDAKLYYYYLRSDSAMHTYRGRDVLYAVELLLKRIAKIDDAEKRERIIIRCYKRVFSARYSEMFSVDYEDQNIKCRELFRKLSVYLPELSLHDRLVMQMLSASPAIYRAWRILGDFSLLEYERDRRKDRNE